MTAKKQKTHATRSTERFLLACLRSMPENERPARLQRAITHDIDWNYLFWLADLHGLQPLLYWALKDTRSGDIPGDFSTRLSEHFHVSSLRNRILFAEFRTLAGLLDEQGIEFIALKGISIASTIYDDPALRQFADIDLLLHDRDIDRAKQLFEAQGFHAIYSHGILTGDATELTPFQDRVFRAFYHQYEFNSKDGLIYIDAHWRLSPRVYPADVSEDMAWRECIDDVIKDHRVKVLPDELKLVYLCAHGAKDGWCKLKWVVDANRLIETRPALDWERTFALARSCRCEKMLEVGLMLSNQLLDTTLPDAALARIRNPRSSARTANRLAMRVLQKPDLGFRVPCIGINHTYLRLCDGLADQVRHVFRVLTYPHVRDCNTLGLNERLLPLWAWLRPVRIVWHCLRRTLSRNNQAQTD